MKTLISTALKVEHGKLLVLNQQALPQREEWLVCHTIDDMVDIIKTLKVRGAPLIGVAAALSLAQCAEQGASEAAIYDAAKQLKASRPTAVNLAYCVDRLLQTYQKNHNSDDLIQAAEIIFTEDAILCDNMARHCAPLIHQNDRILTHCNTGGLVTTGIGTALGAVIKAKQDGKNPFVYVDETRPLLQGGRLTAWECLRNAIDHQIICDNMAASLMRAGKIDKVFVGADRIAKNGDAANKIGTYSLAVLAHHHRIPFYVVAPYTTVDLQCETGIDIPIEQRHADEVKGYVHHVQWAPQESDAYNPAFDVTPFSLITAIILDTGIFKPAY